MSAKGNGGTYHYYACSGRQKLGRKGCNGERLPKDRLEAAILGQLGRVITTGDTDQTKALLRILIADPRQQPQRSPAHLPCQRARGLRTDKFSGANRSQVEPLGAAAGRADVA